MINSDHYQKNHDLSSSPHIPLETSVEFEITKYNVMSQFSLVSYVNAMISLFGVLFNVIFSNVNLKEYCKNLRKVHTLLIHWLTIFG